MDGGWLASDAHRSNEQGLDFHGLLDHEKCVCIVGRINKAALGVLSLPADETLADFSLRPPLIHDVDTACQLPHIERSMVTV